MTDKVKPENREPVDDLGGAITYEHAPRKMTLAENIVLTVKVLAGFGLMGAVLWGISIWKSAP